MENLVSMSVAEPESDPVDLDVVSVVTYDGLDWGDQLLHVCCQWTGEQAVIEDACTELVDSLEVD